MPELGHSSTSHGPPSSASEKISDGNNNTTSVGLQPMSLLGSRGLLLWARQQTQGYMDVNVYNLTTSWRDGLAFCAVIHRFRPDLIDFDRLSRDNIAENNELAFTIAERHLGISVLLDVADMVENIVPDKLSVITYVSQLYQYFKDKTPANQGFATKMSLVPKQRSEPSSISKSKRLSPGHQIYALSGTAKRMATALRNVFRSDQAKEDQHHNQHHHHNSTKNKDQNSNKAKRTEELSPVLPRLLAASLGSECTACRGKVFMVERLVAERKLFHRSCFKCSKCGGVLRPGTYQYSLDTEEFCCLFNCQRENVIQISMKPIAETLPPVCDPITPSSPTISNAQGPNGTTAQVRKQFCVVKKNAIQLSSLPQTNFMRPRSNSDDGKSSRSVQESRRSKTVGQRAADRKAHSRSRSLEPRRSRERVRDEERTKRREDDCDDEEDPVVELSVNNAVLKSPPRSPRLNKMKEEVGRGGETIEKRGKSGTPQRSPRLRNKALRGRGGEGHISDTSLDHDSRKTSSEEVDQSDDSFSFKDELMKRIGADDSTEYDSSVSEERRVSTTRSRSSSFAKSGVLISEAPKHDSVKKLRQKFLKIDDMLEEKHKHHYQRKQQDLKRELRSVAAWKQLSEDVQVNSPTKKGRFKVSELRKTRGSNVQRLKNKYLNEVAGTPHRASSTSSDSKEDVNGLRSSSGTASQIDRSSTSTCSDPCDSTSSIGQAQESASSAADDASERDSVVSVSDTLENACQELRDMKQPAGEHDSAPGAAKSSRPSPKRPRKNICHDDRERQENCTDDKGTVTVSNAVENKCEAPNSPPACEDDLGSRSRPLTSPMQTGKNVFETEQREQQSRDIKQVSISFVAPGPNERRPSVSTIKFQDKSSPGLPRSPSCSPSSSPKDSPKLPRRSEPLAFQESGSGDQKDSSESQLPDVQLSHSPSVISLGSQGTGSSCSTPRMSIIIAQEPSSTKINSRYFTVETCGPEGPGEEDAIVEENRIGMDVEGEFRFDSENSRQRKAERRAFRSLQKGVKVCSEKSSLVKDEEIRLSHTQIEAELQALEMMHNELETRGVAMEKILRGSVDFATEKSLENEEEIIRDWLTLVHEKNIIMRRESELIYILQFRNYEDRYRAVESELRHLVSMRDEVKSSNEIKRERELLTELLELVQKRSFVIESLDEDRLRERQEDDHYKLIMTEGVPPPPLTNTWEQKAEYTKVAFSRFYC